MNLMGQANVQEARHSFGVRASVCDSSRAARGR